MNKKLEQLLVEFDQKLDAAIDAKKEILDYIDEEYEIDDVERLDDLTVWCHGIDVDCLKELSKKKKRIKE